MACQISDFHLFLHKISEELGSDELEDLKFLCKDNLKKARLEKIKNSKELFVAIGEVAEDEEKQLDFLRQQFKNISRLDLESEVKNFQQRRKGRLHFCDAQRLATMQTILGALRQITNPVDLDKLNTSPVFFI